MIYLSNGNVENVKRSANDWNRTKPQNSSENFNEKEERRILDSAFDPIFDLNESNQQFSGAHDVKDDERDGDATEIGEEGRSVLVRLANDVGASLVRRKQRLFVDKCSK